MQHATNAHGIVRVRRNVAVIFPVGAETMADALRRSRALRASGALAGIATLLMSAEDVAAMSASLRAAA